MASEERWTTIEFPEAPPKPEAFPAAPPRPVHPIWGRLALAAIVLLAAGLRLWQIDQNGYGTDYYSTTVRTRIDGSVRYSGPPTGDPP